MSTPDAQETPETNDILSNLDSENLPHPTSMKSRLSVLGKELYENIENLILDQNILSNAFNKRNIDKKTIYSSNKYRLNLEVLNSNTISFENILIEEKNKEILFKGEEDEEIEEKEEEKIERKEEKRIDQKEFFEELEKDIDIQIKNVDDYKNKKKEDVDKDFDEMMEKKEEKNNEENNIKDKNKKANMESNTNLIQDLYDYNQEFKEQNKSTMLDNDLDNTRNTLTKDNSSRNTRQKSDMDDIFGILSDDKDKNEKEKEIKAEEEKAKLEKEKEEREKEKKNILNTEYPIELIEEVEKYYNLSNESKEDLYPLNTYQTTHGLCIDFLKEEDPKIQTNFPGNDGEIGEITTLGTDYDNNLYICTNKGKIIKKTRKGEILIKSEKYNESISCIDIVDYIFVTGDDNGNIALWTDKGLNQVLTNVNNNDKIICIKIIEIVNNQLLLLFSDIKGNFNCIKVNNINKNNSDYKNEELEYDYTPIYKIIVFPDNASYIKSQKQSVIIIFVSPQNVGLYYLYPDKFAISKLTVFEYSYGEKGKFYFDVSAGYGFPPVSDLNKGRLGSESFSNYRGSISNTIMIGSEEEENSMLAISYGIVLQIYGFRISEKKEIILKPIGHIINDRPILRNCFISSSTIALMNDNLTIKIINTYDFVPKVYNPSVDKFVTKDFLISYESMNINNFGIIGDSINYEIDKKIIQKDIYNNKLITSNSSIFIVSNKGSNIKQIVLSNYDDVLNSLCDKEDYIRMLWLLSIIFNKKTNLLNKQLNKIERNYNQNNKQKLCDLYLMRFFVSKTIPELQNNNEIYARMLLEFFMETDNFEDLSKLLQLLTGSGLDKYFYENLTKYIANGNLSEIILTPDILIKYIEYYLAKNERLLLNKILLKLNLDTLLQKQILKIILEKELINPYIFTRIKNIQAGKTDYFLPVLYLDSVFKKEYIEKQNIEMVKQNLNAEQLELYNKQLAEKQESMKEEIQKNLNISKDYKKLIKEHNITYFNEDTFYCHEYIGHKFLWYCNKCISGREYPNDTPMSPSRFKETAIKILAYLITKENIQLYLEFDSYSYLQIISRYFLEEKLLGFISGIEINYSKEEKKAINSYLGENASEEFNAFYVYKKIKEGIKFVEVNRYFMKFDFYVMTCQICEKVRNFVFEQKDVTETLTYFSELDIKDFNEEEDLYNCHKKAETDKDINNFKNMIQQNMINLLNYLKSYDLLTEEYVKNLLKKRRIIGYKKIYFYLCEESRNYKECLELRLLEYEKSPDTFNKKDKQELFEWIKKIHDYTRVLENSPKNTTNKEYHKEFKKLLLEYLNQLCKISMEGLSKLIDECYENDDEKEELIRHLGEGQSSALQLKYLDEYFKLKQRDMNENIDKYITYLEMEMDILIKDRNKKRIKQLLIDYKVLCNNEMFKKLEKSRLNDSCIYICQYLGKVKDGVKITIDEVSQKYQNIITVLSKPNYNPIIIDIELKEMYKYFQLGLSVCQNNFLDEEKEDKKIDDSWLDLFNKACEFKIDFFPRYESNKNNIKTREHKKIFNGLQDCIELILETMSDYINLNLLVDIIAKSCEKWKTIEFYTFLDKSFYSFRRSEQILKCGKNLMSTSILIQYDDIMELRTLGSHLFIDEEKCNFCKFSLKGSSNSFWMFACGHKYHISCTKLDKGEKICYICKLNEIRGDEDKVKELQEGDVAVDIINNEEEKEDEEDLEKKQEERERKIIVKKRLNALKKFRKKRREIDSLMKNTDIYE